MNSFSFRLFSFQARAGLALSEARLGNRQTPY
jgi:hypothetical protein